VKRIWRKVYAYLDATDRLPKVSVTSVARTLSGRPKTTLGGELVTTTTTRPMTRQEFGVMQRDRW
jgi:hypothetical protein